MMGNEQQEAEHLALGTIVFWRIPSADNHHEYRPAVVIKHLGDGQYHLFVLGDPAQDFIPASHVVSAHAGGACEDYLTTLDAQATEGSPAGATSSAADAATTTGTYRPAGW